MISGKRKKGSSMVEPVMATKSRGGNDAARPPRGNRIVPTEVPATKCGECGNVWPDRKTPRANRTMCPNPKCRTIKPESFTATTLPGYVCVVCNYVICPRPSTVKKKTVRCRECGAYLR